MDCPMITLRYPRNNNHQLGSVMTLPVRVLFKSHWDGLQYRTPTTNDFEILWGHVIKEFSGPVVRVLNLAHRLHPCCGRLCKWQRLEWWSNSVTGNIYVGCAKGLRAELKCWFFSNMFLFPHAFLKKVGLTQLWHGVIYCTAVFATWNP